MSEPQWLDGHSGQTTDELIALDGAFRTDSIVLAFEQALLHKAFRIGTEHLTEAERVVLTIEALEREVNNGGYDQLFRNVPDQVPQLVQSLTAIGCVGVAELTLRAISLLHIDGRLTPEAVDSAMEHGNEERDQRLSEIDEAYYETAGDLAGPLLAFIKTNRDHIALT